MELAGTGIRTLAELTGDSASGVNKNEDLGKKQFLELMIAQMNHQDPLDPAKNEDFIAQLAQFSTVEGIENLNNSFSSMAASLQSSMTSQAASLVGRHVVVPTGATTLEPGSGIVGSIEVPRATGGVTLEISTAAGELVRRIDLGAQPSGRLGFGWDGTDANGDAAAAGAYRLNAYADVDGERSELTVNLPDQVVSVSLGTDGLTVNLAGGSSVAASQIKEIQ